MADVKEELKNIQGEEDDKSNLYELWDDKIRHRRF